MVSTTLPENSDSGKLLPMAHVRLPLLPNNYTVAYPPTGPDKVPEPVEYFPLSDILTRGWTTDAHTAAYSVEGLRYRLSTKAVNLEGDVRMVALIIDVDCEQSHAASGGHGDVPAPDAWWLSELAKVHQLLEAFPGAFIYRTRGGYRIVYLLASPRVLCSAADVDGWKAEYLSWIGALRLRFQIYADPSCHDWPRLYRCPHATRSLGARPEALETLGNPCDIGVWTCEPTVEEREVGKTLAKRPRNKPSREPRASVVNAGDGVLFHAFQSRGWIGKALEAGKWAVQCPWDDQHTKGETFDTSTILYAPGPGHTLGYLHCSHAHCQSRDSRDVLAAFPRAELDGAEMAAGLPPFQPTSNGNHRAEIRDVPPLALAEVVSVFHDWLHMPHLQGALYVVLGTYAANRMAGDPLWLMLVGGSGWGKTEILLSIVRLPHVHLASTLTEASLLSGSSRREKGKDSTGGLLRKVGEFGYLLAKDFTSILSMNREASTAMLAALREIYDGSWVRHVGVDGGRSLPWQGKLAMIAGCTGAIDRFHAVVGALGERFVSFRLRELDATKQGSQALQLLGQESTMRQALSDAVGRLFTGMTFPSKPFPLDDKETASLVALASLAALCRSPVIRDYRQEIELILDREAPSRLVMSLSRLYTGMRVVGVAPEDARPLIYKAALDCMPALRRDVFDSLADSDERWKTDELGIALGYPYQTIKRTLEDLTAHGVVCRHRTGKSDQWNLSDEAASLFRLAKEVFHK